MDEALTAYLTNWKRLMSGDNRLNVVRWISGGSRENESMVVSHLLRMERDMLARFPALDSMIYTNCVDVDGWSGSYVVDLPPVGHIFERGILLSEAMCQVEGLGADSSIT